MSDSKTMMLAKKYDEKRVSFPCYVSPKYDGVPVVIRYEDGLRATAYTRQGEVVHSINHILAKFDALYQAQQIGADIVYVGELYRHGRPFKDISGEVRKQDGTRADVGIKLFDAFIPDSDMPFHQRLLYTMRAEELIGDHRNIQAADVAECANAAELARTVEYHALEGYEGSMVRSRDHKYEVAKRSWGMMKVKPEPTVDLKIVSFEEAVSKEGEPLGMVGRINCEYHGQVIGVGPGKLTHGERTAVWRDRQHMVGMICEVQYMQDESYDALRQPTFQRFRTDKTEPSYE